MKRVKTRLVTALLTITCIFACLGVFVTLTTDSVAQAATTFTISKLTPLASSTTAVVEAYPTNEAEKPTVKSWDYTYSFVEGSGDGFLWNGEAYTGWMIKCPNDFYIELGTTASAGDELVLDGTFYNATADVNIVFKKCGLRYSGSAWESFVAPHNIGALVLHVNSTAGGAAGSYNDRLYLQRADGKALPFLSWDYAFTYESGDGFTVNGVKKTPSAIKSTGDGFYWGFEAVNAGDVISISGIFFCESQAVKYNIEESHFIWDGSKWSVYVPPIVYDVYKVSEIRADVDSSATAIHIVPKNGDGSSFGAGDWDNKYTLEAGTGEGLKLNNTVLETDDIKQPGAFFVGLGTTAKTGDVLTVDGAYYNDTTKKKIVFSNCQLQWNGSAWVEYEKTKTYNIGKVVIGANSSATAVYFDKASGAAFEVTEGTWTEKLTYESGIGIKLNDTTISMDDIKIPNNLYVGLGTTAKKGDVLTIGGTFSNENLGVKYVIDESKFEWNGTAWVEYIAYTTYELGVMTLNSPSKNASQALNTQLYLNQENGNALPYPDADWKTVFKLYDGEGLVVNGNKVALNEMKSTDIGLFLLFGGVKAGDVVTVSGTFVCPEKAAKYVIEDSTFTWNGKIWVSYVSESDLAFFDTVTTHKLGLGFETEINATAAAIDSYIGLSYVADPQNTTGSIKFRFGYNSTSIASGTTEIRLRGTGWCGIRFLIQEGQIKSFYSTTSTAYKLSSENVIELGAIDLKDGANIWIYAKVDGVVVISDTVKKTDNDPYEEGTPAFSTFNTSNVSIYFGEGVTANITDPDHVSVTYNHDNGSFTEYVSKNSEYTLAGKKAYNTFIGWVIDGKLYKANEIIEVGATDITVEALTIDFTLEAGASIRISNSADNSGIRFTARIDKEQLDNLKGKHGIKDISYGTLILPYDYLDAGQEPNLDDFTVNEDLLKIESDPEKEGFADGKVVYRGAMKKLYEANYERLFAGRGYMEITFEDGSEMVVYTPFDIDDNVRSIRSVAQKFMHDETEPVEGEVRYNSLSAEAKAVVDAYAEDGQINLMRYDEYTANNALDVIAWYYPELDPSNAYNNATNIAIAKKLTDAGITTVYLDGMYHLDLNTNVNVEKTRQIIHFFWSQGLKTIAFGSNASTNCYIDYSVENYPDFSDCEGFEGFLVWDEPSLGEMGKLAAFANNFEATYAGTDVTFMTNLLPSYASIFNGDSNWWESSIASLDKNAFKNYLKQYCDTVLSQIDGGKKWLSLDTYPINEDKSLTVNFLFDLAMLKYYAEYAGAVSHVALQSSGWTEGNNSKNRMPTEAEMRMQAYAAMAFGIDSISWWSYSDKREDNQSNPTDSDDYYERFANVNNELKAIGHVYGAFNWKGVILGTGKDNGNIFDEDTDYESFNAVKDQIGDYELSADKTKHLASVSTNKTNWNYLMGVMEDMNGNEGYVLCNYNSHEEDRAQTITITFDSNVTEVIIYRGGVAQTVAVTNKTLTVALATGEGVMILPSKLG